MTLAATVTLYMVRILKPLFGQLALPYARQDVSFEPDDFRVVKSRKKESLLIRFGMSGAWRYAVDDDGRRGYATCSVLRGFPVRTADP